MRILFGCEGIDDLFEPGIAAKRIPEREQFQLAVAKAVWPTHGGSEPFAGEIFLASPSIDHREILVHRLAVDGIFFYWDKFDRTPALFQSFDLSAQEPRRLIQERKVPDRSSVAHQRSSAVQRAQR